MRNPPTYLSLFSGIGGLDLGLDRAGWRCVGQVEKDPFCQRVLAKHWPEVPRHDDVATAVQWWNTEPRPAVDAVVGGFPCQPSSTAGARLAQDDPRWLWPEMAGVLGALRPPYAVLENVGLFTAGFGDVLGDLAALGFDAEWGVLSACAMGAPHPRERVFVLAHAQGQPWRPAPGRPEGAVRAAACARSPWLPVAEPGHSGWWDTEPRLDRVAHGVSARVDRRTALGNAVVPQVGEQVGRMVRHLASAVTRPYPPEVS